MAEYFKFKERTPEDTVFKIRGILREIGVFPILKWEPGEFSGVSSNRVYLDPVNGLGTNGKGTTERYAEASAFAELIERIQNCILHIRTCGPQESPYTYASRYPDEKNMEITELVSQNDAFLDALFGSLGFDLRIQRELYLSSMADILYGKKDGTIPVIPFTDLIGDRIVWLPVAVVISFCGSNGMSAGNTMEEALVQDFSEILERYAQHRILDEGLTPPEIPREELEDYSLWPLICRIEATGRYRVSIRDCSLGEEGLPVAAVVIADRERGSFGVKFGCHPSFPVSVERTLTEAFQGKKLEVFTKTNSLGDGRQVHSYDNFTNTAKTGTGFYPAAFFGAQPSWEYRPWKQWECAGGQGNREYLKKLIRLITEKGCVPLIRDASHLGFPSYFIVVPGMSEMYERTGLRIRDIQAAAKVRKMFGHFPDLERKEEETLLRLILFKEGSVIENGLDIISGRFFKGDLFTANRVGAYLALKMNRFPVAAGLFGRAALSVQEEWERQHLTCMMEYAGLLGNGASREDALSSLSFLFGRDAAARVREETADPETMLQKVFPKLNCFDCEHCPLSGVHCEYPEAAKILRKLNRAMEHTAVSQENLLERLKEL
ncbi:MAG: YcaO-like family protein [Oscillospiraceae bacterium]|nr:YcaO-like family protein [Oscillospiraceae bacterium]